MRKISKLFAVLGALFVALCSCLLFASCGEQNTTTVLRVYNWEEYLCNETIEEEGLVDLITGFEEKYNCKIEYSTFGTNENMYNELKINTGSYDLVCPSDYMIMKMIKEGMCEEFSNEFLTNSSYAKNVSPYIKGIFEKHGWDKYAVGYMWGTMGFMYNPECSPTVEADVASWKVLEQALYHKSATLKDSVRDTYFYALACVYQDELIALANRYKNEEIDATAYNEAINDIMNRTDAESVEKARVYLREVKKNIYGFEVDSGKNDMVTGKIDINFCWSGDAAFGIYEAGAEDGKTLGYRIPDYVSNIWFDGWVIPKGGNRDLAEKFLDYISTPQNAIANMNYIGYTSVIAGEDVKNFVLDSYSVEEAGEDTMDYDLSYFFGSPTNFIAPKSEEFGMLGAQYPTEEVINRCAIMEFFDEDANKRINMMWEDVKGAEIPLPAIIFIAVVIVCVGGGFIVIRYGHDWFRPKPKKGYTKVEK